MKVHQLKYQRVEAEIRQLAETLPVGAKLPAEKSLASTYGCNFLTVRKALRELVLDGTIVRRIGSGTFISRHQNGNGHATNGNHKRVGVLVYGGSNAYAYRTLQAIAHAGLEMKIGLHSAWARDFPEDALVRADELQRDGCVALTLPWFPHERSEEVHSFVTRAPLPVSLAIPVPGLEMNCFIDPTLFGSNIAIDEICRYFQLLGHRRIALLGPDSTSDMFLQKLVTAFVCHTSRENLPSPCGMVAPGAQMMDQLAKRWTAYKGELAVVSYDDEHALRFMTSMHKLGLNAPGDYAIVGFNDTEGSRYSDPPLSTVHQDFDYIAHGLLTSALALSKGELAQSTTIPRQQMLVRSTCGGSGRIDDAFKAHFQKLEILQDPGDPGAGAAGE